MLHALVRILFYLKWWTVSIDTLVIYIWPRAKPEWQITLKREVIGKWTAVTATTMPVSKDTCCPLSLWYLRGSWWAFWECRMSCVYVQHHITVVTSNGVTICSIQFPPTVSKHCQHQQSAIHKTIPTIWNTNNRSCFDIQGAASSVRHHGSHCSQQ